VTCYWLSEAFFRPVQQRGYLCFFFNFIKILLITTNLNAFFISIDFIRLIRKNQTLRRQPRPEALTKTQVSAVVKLLVELVVDEYYKAVQHVLVACTLPTMSVQAACSGATRFKNTSELALQCFDKLEITQKIYIVVKQPRLE
jgi:hypothetical protein